MVLPSKEKEKEEREMKKQHTLEPRPGVYRSVRKRSLFLQMKELEENLEQST